MKFCPGCKSFLYIDLDAEKNLLYYCKNCSYQDVIKKGEGSICVIDDNQINDVTRYSQFVNPYLEHDPTLPRVNNIKCTNEKCTKKVDEDNEVIYVKYDFINMRYLYFCTHCKHYWRNQ